VYRGLGLPSRPRSSNNFTSRLPLTLVPVKPAARTRTAPTASRARASARVLVHAASGGGTSNSRRKRQAVASDTTGPRSRRRTANPGCQAGFVGRS
jgi:hypothetical protein